LGLESGRWGCGLGGTRQHPVASAVAMGAGAAGVVPCPAPPRCVTGKRNRGKGKGGDEADRGSHM
jgi:hypothetical protein